MPYDWVSNGLGEAEGGVVKSKAKVSPKRHWTVQTRQVEPLGPAHLYMVSCGRVRDSHEA